MSKLLKLKRWLTIQEAADYVQSLLDGAPVSGTDLLQLGLQHRLQLSAVFPDTVLAEPLRQLQHNEVKFGEVCT
jgi:hypothetical protein